MNILLPGFFHCPLLKVKTLSLGHPWRNKEKKTARTEGPKISNVFTNTSDLDAVKQVKQRNHQIWLGRFKSLQFFQRTNPSRPLSGSDLPSSLLQLSINPPWRSSHSEYNWRGLWISSTPKYLGSKLTTDFPLSSDLPREVVVWCLLNFHPMACYAILAPPWHTWHFLRTPRNRPARKTRKSCNGE